MYAEALWFVDTCRFKCFCKVMDITEMIPPHTQLALCSSKPKECHVNLGSMSDNKINLLNIETDVDLRKHIDASIISF